MSRWYFAGAYRAEALQRLLQTLFWIFIVLIVYSSAILTDLLLSGRTGAAVHGVLAVLVFVEYIAGYSLTFQVINMMLVIAVFSNTTISAVTTDYINWLKD